MFWFTLRCKKIQRIIIQGRRYINSNEYQCATYFALRRPTLLCNPLNNDNCPLFSAAAPKLNISHKLLQKNVRRHSSLWHFSSSRFRLSNDKVDFEPFNPDNTHTLTAVPLIISRCLGQCGIPCRIKMSHIFCIFTNFNLVSKISYTHI